MQNIWNSIYDILKTAFLSGGVCVKYFLALSMCVLLFIFLYKYGAEASRRRYQTVLEKIRYESNKYMHNAKFNKFNYELIEEKLSRTGIAYYTKGRLTPLFYVALKIFSMLAGIILSTYFFNIFIGIITGITFFLAPDLIFKIINNSDNEKMQEDIMNMSDIIILQASAGTYITQILIDAYLCVQTPRLKDALLELTGNIKSKGNISESINIFQKRFDNADLSDISVALAQSMETGNASQMLKDIKEHAVIMQKNHALNIERKVKGRTFVLSMFIFLGIIAILMWGMSGSIMENLEMLNA